MQHKVSKVAPEDHQKLTDAETLGEASNEASCDDTEDVEDNAEARQALVLKLVRRNPFLITKSTIKHVTSSVIRAVS